MRADRRGNDNRFGLANGGAWMRWHAIEQTPIGDTAISGWHDDQHVRMTGAPTGTPASCTSAVATGSSA